ncbi:hypothetical protein QUB80_10195 [Chlorogloeopsis sp. ULAP01]|nr:hypothetical protein [Chlorogloeopsis sp. ULAP01]
MAIFKSLSLEKNYSPVTYWRSLSLLLLESLVHLSERAILVLDQGQWCLFYYCP